MIVGVAVGILVGLDLASGAFVAMRRSSDTDANHRGAENPTYSESGAKPDSFGFAQGALGKAAVRDTSKLLPRPSREQSGPFVINLERVCHPRANHCHSHSTHSVAVCHRARHAG